MSYNYHNVGVGTLPIKYAICFLGRQETKGWKKVNRQVQGVQYSDVLFIVKNSLIFVMTNNNLIYHILLIV